MSDLGSEGHRCVGSSVLLPLQLSNEVGRIGGLEPTSRETKTFPDQFELSGEHVLLLEELAQYVVVLAEAGDIGDNAEVVESMGGVAELLEVGGAADEHVVEPRGEGDRDETAHGRSIDWFGIGPFSRLLVAREPVDAGGIARVETNEAGLDHVAILADVEARDEVIVANITLGRGVPALGNLAQVFFEVGNDVLESGDLGGVLRGAGLYGERKTVDELPELLGGDVGVSVKGGEHRSRRQWRGVGKRSSGW